ncbi:magnesium transporter [Methanohalobium sp.]|uniref:magnesium transporter n=1 Tax=Methanohalobium sp. TaxID=2837493 RepID=UPI0025D50D98|nr:magnesium transporter [Methanohalobium sp.]
MSYYTVPGIVKRSLPVLFVTTIIGIFSGQILNARIENLVSLPSLLVLIPALIKVGGDTGSMLGARLSSAFHLGMGGNIHKNPVVKNSLLGALIVGITACFILSIVVWSVSNLMGIGLEYITFFKICMIAGILELIAVYAITVLIAFASQRFGLDPDDTVIPLIATLGDLIGVAGIFTTLYLIGLI